METESCLWQSLERERGRDIVWEAIAVTWVKVILARNGAVSVGEMRIPEVEWADWHLIDQWA